MDWLLIVWIYKNNAMTSFTHEFPDRERAEGAIKAILAEAKKDQHTHVNYVITRA